MSGGQLNYHVPTATDNHVLYATGKNGTGTELLRIAGTGEVGIGTAAPFSLLANTATNVVGADGYGVGAKSLTWASDLAGYAGAIFNASPGAGQNGLAVKVAGANAAATALDLSQGAAGAAGTSLLTVRANGYVGIGSAAPGATLEVRRGAAPDGTAAFWGTARTSHFNYSTAEDTYLRGGKASSNVYLNDTGGNVGLGGTDLPLTRLAISPSAVEPKITLYDGGSSTNHYGFGVSGSQFNYHVGSTSDAHIFYAGGKNGNELMRIKGNGTVGIGLANPFSTSRLHLATRDLYAGVFVSSPNAALASTQTVRAEVFTTQNITDAVAVFGQSVSGANGEYGTGGVFRGNVGVYGAGITTLDAIGGQFVGHSGVTATGTSTNAQDAPTGYMLLLPAAAAASNLACMASVAATAPSTRTTSRAMCTWPAR